MNIGKIIKELRLKNGMTQEELSLRLGVTRPYIHMLEDGERNASPDLMDGMAIVFDIPVSIISFMAMEEKDIPEKKREAFKKLKPSIDDMIVTILG